MYKIYAKNGASTLLIYDDTSDDTYLKVGSPHLTLEENVAGTLKFTIPPGNAGYEFIIRMSTEIIVTKDDVEIWSGRVLQESKDFWNQRTLTCEGAFAFFNDSVQPKQSYSFVSDYGIQQYIQALLTKHNSTVTTDERFSLGAVTVHGSIEIETNYETTMECLNKLVQEHGGYMQVRRENGIRYLDYLDEEPATSTQKIVFGKNLIDFTRSFDLSDIATVLVPLGAKQESGEGESDEDNYLTVESVNDGSIYVTLDTQAGREARETYGNIAKVVHWDDVDSPSVLMSKAIEYLTAVQFENMIIELSALDLHYLNPSIQAINIGERVQVVSEPHGLNLPFPVKKLDIPLDQPQNTKFQLGTDIKLSFTSANNKVNGEILEALEQNDDAILEAAKSNAIAIMNMKTNGYITITTDEYGSNELIISEQRPVEKQQDGTYNVNRLWRFSMNGLGYTDDGGETWKTAITMDGSILGERIAAGSIHGSKITAGSLDIVTSSGQSGLSIALKSRGMAPGSFAIGDIQTTGSNAGKNIASTTRARSILKTYLTLGTKITFNSSDYRYELIEYSDNNDAESGFVRLYGDPQDNPYTVASTNYYRFVVRKTNGGTINQNELNTIAAAFDFGGSTAVFTAQDFQFLGAVTFTDLDATASSTFINGANIKTGTIAADRISLYGLIVTDKDGNPTFTITSESDQGGKGQIYINAQVDLSSSSIIRFNGGGSETLGEVVDDLNDNIDNVNLLAYGAYTPPTNITINGHTYTASDTFISGRFIYSPTIISQEFIAQASNSQLNKTGSFILRDGEEHNRLTIQYSADTDTYPKIYFSTNTAGQGYDYSEFDFNNRIVIHNGFEDDSGSEDNIYGIMTIRANGGCVKFGAGNNGTGGKLFLGYGTTYVDHYTDLPTGLTSSDVGRVCFVLN